jgi:hypothetical protein
MGTFRALLPAAPWREPLVLMRGFGLGSDDPAVEVLAAFPDAKADEAKAEERAEHWTREWVRRFPHQ